MAVGRELCIADIEANAQRAGAIEQLRNFRIRHATLEIVLERLAFEDPAWKEGGERKLRKYHQPRALRGCLVQQLDHARQRMRAGIGLLRRPHLGGSGAKNTAQTCLRSMRPAVSVGAMRCDNSAP